MHSASMRRLAALAGLLAWPALAQPGADASPEYVVKAAFLYNFTRFVEWPAGPVNCGARPLSIAVLGQDPFGAALDRTVAGRRVGGRAIRVQRLPRVAEVEPCTLLFVTAAESERLGEILAALRARPVLVVGESPGFTRRGGAIGFHVDGKRVRFETNRRAAAAAGLALSSRLLALASAVDGDSLAGSSQ